VESRLRLDLSVVRAPYGTDEVYLNNLRLFSGDIRERISPALTTALTAPQVIESTLHFGPHAWKVVGEPKLGYQISIRGSPAPFEDKEDTITFKLHIIEVGGRIITGIDDVMFKILKTESGRLVITDLKAISVKNTPSTSHPGQECTTIVCKWRAIIAHRLSKTKGCGGKSRPGSSSAPAEPKEEDHVRPGAHSHRPHGHRQKHRHIIRLLQSVVLHIFLPIAIGIVVGVTASLVGMLAGHLIVFLWRIFFRRGTKGTYSKVQQQTALDEEGSDESRLLKEPQGPPPLYEEVLLEEKALE